jgi:hypothetical protein
MSWQSVAVEVMVGLSSHVWGLASYLAHVYIHSGTKPGCNHNSTISAVNFLCPPVQTVS